MSYNFSKSEVIAADANSLMKESERDPYDRFVAAYGELGAQPCPFCSQTPKRFYSERIWTVNDSWRLWSPGGPGGDEDAWTDTHMVICPNCMWFRAKSVYMHDQDTYVTDYFGTYQERTSGLSALPIERIEAHLARKWEDWKELTAGQAEDLVAGVFAEHMDAKVHYTTNGVYSPDGGIDFVLVETQTGLEYAFQVKRRLTDKPESVRPIREFIGGVALHGYERGYFVTFAPRTTKAAEQEVKQGRASLARRGLSIQVIDGSRLYDILRNSRNAHLRDHWVLDGQVWSTTEDAWYEIPLTTDRIIATDLVTGGPRSLKEILATL